jgi:quaternary ammonium compound-resistance protein SugE
LRVFWTSPVCHASGPAELEKFWYVRTKLIPSVLFVVLGVASLLLLSLALRSLPVGTAYAVWTGIGAIGTAILGIVLLGEPAQAIRLASIGLIVAGVIGLNLAGSH